MTLSQRAQQKKREKKAEKRKEAKKSSAGRAGIWTFSREWVAAAHAPVVDVLIAKTLFERGIGTVWLSRRLPTGRVAFAGFLVDTYCLGVKNAFGNIVDADEYGTTLEHILGSVFESMQREHPACARKLLEQAVAYAEDLGFKPHKDYKIYKIIFGDADPSTCAVPFVFGKNGKPFYITGPNDMPALQRRILAQLEKRCGPGGYHYLLDIPEEG
jgi:hypothetical protein